MPHPLLAARARSGASTCSCVTSDRGLCGGYNANLIRQRRGASCASTRGSERALTRRRPQGARLLPQAPRRRRRRASTSTCSARPTIALARAARRSASARDFADGRDRRASTSSTAASAPPSSQVPTRRAAPARRAPRERATAAAADYIFEPRRRARCSTACCRATSRRVIAPARFLESIASEHGARMTAMENATTQRIAT